MNKIAIKNLEPGQEVALANCRETGHVVARIAKNLYRVTYQGRTADMMRQHLGVNVRGRWMFGPHNAQP